MSALRKISAIHAGRDRSGKPLARRVIFEADERREDWGDNRTRIFYRRRDLEVGDGTVRLAPAVVFTDSIEEVIR